MRAARLYADNLDDVEEATVVYCSIQAYATALATARLQNREDLVETVIVPQMVNTARGYVKEMEEKEGKLERVAERLLVVRETKRQAAEVAEQEADGKTSE